MGKLIGKRAVVVVLWMLAAYAFWRFLGAYFAPEGCLDFGGSFDYEAWECSYEENKEYIETPLFLVPGFFPAFLLLIVAVGATVIPRLIRRKKQQE